MNLVTKVLEEAKARIEQGWCQNAWAEDANGNSVDRYKVGGPTACSWCAISSIEAVWFAKKPSLPLNEQHPWYQDRVKRWNDAPGRRQEGILVVFDAAIAKSKEAT